MNITNEKEIIIWRKDLEDGKCAYSVSLSKKLEDGNYENGYITCRFKKGTELQNQTKVKIKSAWLSFYKDKDKHTIPYIFINDFDLVDNNVNENDLHKDKHAIPYIFTNDFDVAGEAKEEDLQF